VATYWPIVSAMDDMMMMMMMMMMMIIVQQLVELVIGWGS
jgi:hypothetical protein